MPDTITIRDETISGQTLHEFAIEIPDETITVRELIRSRVYQEVKDYNARLANGQQVKFHGLVQPSETEEKLNGQRASSRKPIQWERQLDRAQAAFRSHQILILIDDQQVSNLDDEVTIKPASRVSFLRLTLLTGG